MTFSKSSLKNSSFLYITAKIGKCFPSSDAITDFYLRCATL
nr:MAG TPA: hypothetical protein [Caudoviricetes sp.]